MAEKIEFDLSVKGGAAGNELNKALDGATDKASALGDTLKTSLAVFGGNLLTKGFDVLKNTISEAVNESVKFRRAQLEIETILPKNTKLTSQLVDQLDDLSKQYGTTATAQAKAYYEIISAGVNDAADGAKLLARANQLAVGGVTDTASTIDLLTTIYNVYGREVATAAEASDSLFKTVQIGKTTIKELAADLGQALPIAKSFGIGLDEVGAVLAQLTNSGISTSESVTLLNAVLSAIAKNGDKLGQGFNSFAVQTEGLGVVLERLRERTKGSNDALFDLLGRQEAVRAVQSLTAKGLENYNATLAEYSKKAGVAAEASQKIIDGDIGKQFEILGSKIASATRQGIDVFIPFVREAIKLTNELFTPDETVGVENALIKTRKELVFWEKGLLTAGDATDRYREKITILKDRIAELSNIVAVSPQQTLINSVKNEVDTLTKSITEAQSGLDSFGLPNEIPSQGLLALNAKLDAAKARLAELQSVTPETTAAVATPVDNKQLENEMKLQADIKSIREQAALEAQSFAQVIFQQDTEAILINKQLEIDALYQKEVDKLAIITQAELDKTAFIKNEEERRLTEQKIKEDARLKNIQLFNKKEQDLRAAQKTFEKKNDAEALNDKQAFYSAATSLQSANNKALAAVGKAFAVQQATMQGYQAVQSSYTFGTATGGPILGTTFAAIAAAASAANIAKIVGIPFENGGIVGQTGASAGADNRVATIKDGEMMLNASQQKTLFDAINNGTLGGGNIQVIIDGREVAVAVRNQVQSGFRLT